MHRFLEDTTKDIQRFASHSLINFGKSLAPQPVDVRSTTTLFPNETQKTKNGSTKKIDDLEEQLPNPVKLEPNSESKDSFKKSRSFTYSQIDGNSKHQTPAGRIASRIHIQKQTTPNNSGITTAAQPNHEPGRSKQSTTDTEINFEKAKEELQKSRNDYEEHKEKKRTLRENIRGNTLKMRYTKDDSKTINFILGASSILSSRKTYDKMRELYLPAKNDLEQSYSSAKVARKKDELELTKEKNKNKKLKNDIKISEKSLEDSKKLLRKEKKMSLKQEGLDKETYKSKKREMDKKYDFKKRSKISSIKRGITRRAKNLHEKIKHRTGSEFDVYKYTGFYLANNAYSKITE